MKGHPRGALRSIEEAQEALDRLGFLYAVCACGNPTKVGKLHTNTALHLTPSIWNIGVKTPPPFQDDYLFGNYWDAWAYLCKIKLAQQPQTAV